MFIGVARADACTYMFLRLTDCMSKLVVVGCVGCTCIDVCLCRCGPAGCEGVPLGAAGASMIIIIKLTIVSTTILH